MARSAPHAWHGTPLPGGPTPVVGVHPGQDPGVVGGTVPRRLVHAQDRPVVVVPARHAW